MAGFFYFGGTESEIEKSDLHDILLKNKFAGPGFAKEEK